MRKTTRKLASLVLAGALVVTAVPVNSDAAAAVKLNKTSVTLKVKGKTTLKVSKVNKKVKSITKKVFTSNKKSVATVGKTTGKITAKKAGSATIKCKVTYKIKSGKKTVKKSATLTCSVTVKKTTSTTPTKAPATQAPATQAPATQAPTSAAPASGTPASQAPASEAPASGTPASQAPTSAAPSASASAAPSATPAASASAAPSASASAAPSIVPATAVPGSAASTATPAPLVADFTFTEDNVGVVGTTSIAFKNLTHGEDTIQIRKVEAEEQANSIEWNTVKDGAYTFDGLTKNTKYTFAAKVEGSNDVKKLEVSTLDENLTIEGALTWESGKIFTAGSIAATEGLSSGTDLSEYVDSSELTYKNGENDLAAGKVEFTLLETISDLDKNVEVPVKVVVTTANGTVYNGQTAAVVLVKAAAPVVTLSSAKENVAKGYVKIDKINGKTVSEEEDIPAGLQYVVSDTAANAAASDAWADIETVEGLSFKNGEEAFTDGGKIFFKIKDSAQSDAADGWKASDVSDAVAVATANIGTNAFKALKTELEAATSGTIEMTEDVTVPEDGTLTVPADVTLTIGEGNKLINNGTITNNGTIANNGRISNSGKFGALGTITGNDFILGTEYFSEGDAEKNTNSIKTWYKALVGVERNSVPTLSDDDPYYITAIYRTSGDDTKIRVETAIGSSAYQWSELGNINSGGVNLITWSTDDNSIATWHKTSDAAKAVGYKNGAEKGGDAVAADLKTSSTITMKLYQSVEDGSNWWNESPILIETVSIVNRNVG